jgi:hypothetical protein
MMADSVRALILNALLEKFVSDHAIPSDFLFTAAFLITCRESQAISPGLTQLFSASPFAAGTLAITEKPIRTVRDLTVLDCISFRSAVHFSFALRIDSDVQWVDSAFIRKLLLNTESEDDRHVQLRQALSDMVNHPAQHGPIVQRSASQGTLSSSCPTTQELFLNLENQYQERRRIYLNQFHVQFNDLFQFATQKHSVVGTSQFVYTDAGISVKIQQCETAWWRFWLPMSAPNAPWQTERAILWTRSLHFSISSTPVVIGQMVPRTLVRPMTTLPVKNRLSSVIRYNCKYYEFNKQISAQILCSSLWIILSLPSAVHIIEPSEIVMLVRRLPSAVEFFTTTRRSFFIEFDSPETPDIIDRISSLYTSVESHFHDEMPLTQLWKNGVVSNVTYLARLNLFAGRSFHKFAIYPIFPAVITDSLTFFRDLQMPLGLNYALTNQFYLFADGPLPLAAVTSYLSRTNFDTTFHRFELIPEFFTLPDLFANAILPSWAHDPVDFVYQQRKSLEAGPTVSNLHHWIDRLFGYRQRDRHDDKNLYKEELYETIWTQMLDPAVRHDIDEMGCLPRRIFQSPHPHRSPLETEGTSGGFTVTIASECAYAFMHEGAIAVVDGSGFVQLHPIDFGAQSIGNGLSIEIKDQELTKSLRNRECIIVGRQSDSFLVARPPNVGYSMIVL